jgi:hypothetical protein
LYNIKGKLKNIFETMNLLTYFKTTQCDCVTKLEDNMLESIPTDKNPDSNFVLDVHKDIIETRPELEPEFNNLFKVLHSYIKKI